MKLLALSDLHGNLVNISGSYDVLIIAGDWSPLYIQNCYNDMMSWISYDFIKWLSGINAKHIIFIPGNHDFVCTMPSFRYSLDSILLQNGLKNRIHYLNCTSVKLYNKKFYGLPFTEGLNGWAFSSVYNPDYSFDSDTDILVTHQPPKFGNVGLVKYTNKDFGSISLRNEILNSNISLNICGHIHTGDHSTTKILLNNGREASVYNVSLLDEYYRIAYKPTVIKL